ncbi:hypothetical protein EHQ52_16340 [Leptospira koniambonensis]|uniref:Histidine kinase n=1 Tax=Leptospira koniambonensis TaxID=2484950 RepID=A0A4R9J5Q9_9LEPT|nr:hypothetical protein [Leptospira koniambonensis]TGL31500.1 hypothetical protein EHQ52_16340 [Leptospira koniambonensis]
MESVKEKEIDRFAREEFYSQNYRIASYFFGIVCAITIWGAILEYVRSNFLLLYLDLISAFICLFSLGVIHFYSKNYFKKNLIVFGGLFILLVLEVETQFHDNEYYFYDNNMWITNQVILFLVSLFFNGRPIFYTIYSFSVVAFYILRIFPEGSGYFSDRTLWVQISNMSALQLFICLCNTWWYGYRIESLKKTKKLQERLHDEREAITRDLHDYLGAKVTDLNLLVRSIQGYKSGDTDALLQLEKLSEDIFKGIREITASMADVKLISEDIWSGIRVLLLRRYGNAGRKVRFTREGEENFNIDTEKAEQILGIVTEICSNDLKYGSGTSHWIFSPKKDSIEISIRTHTNFQEMRIGSKGNKTIQFRTSAINGEWKENLENRDFKGFLEIPIRQLRRI